MHDRACGTVSSQYFTLEQTQLHFLKKYQMVNCTEVRMNARLRQFLTLKIETISRVCNARWFSVNKTSGFFLWLKLKRFCTLKLQSIFGYQTRGSFQWLRHCWRLCKFWYQFQWMKLNAICRWGQLGGGELQRRRGLASVAIRRHAPNARWVWDAALMLICLLRLMW
jgi:hypothetical protein